jgi:hypothetical protein
MAISEVGSYSGTASAGGDVTVNLAVFLPGLQENDLLVVFGGHPANGTNSGVSTSGYTELFDLTTVCRFSASWKRMGATPDTSVTCIGSGGANDSVVYNIYAFRGVDTSTAIDATTTNTAGTGDPNSPSITTVTNGAVVLSLFGIEGDVATYTQPTGYSAGVVGAGTSSVEFSAGGAYKAIPTAGAENPSPWDVDVTSKSWQAVSVALRPATSGTFGDGVLSATGTGTASLTPGSVFQSKFAATGTGTASLIGESFSNQPVPFSMTGTVSVDWSGGIGSGGAASMTATATAIFVGARDQMTSVRETIESRGAATVSVG